MNTGNQSPLGQTSTYPDQYDASVLFPIARAPQRSLLGIGSNLPFLGADLWTAFELSWLNARGKPQVALAHVTVPCESVNLIESKSFKLYLGSFNHTQSELTNVASRTKRLVALSIQPHHGHAVVVFPCFQLRTQRQNQGGVLRIQ